MQNILYSLWYKLLKFINLLLIVRIEFKLLTMRIVQKNENFYFRIFCCFVINTASGTQLKLSRKMHETICLSIWIRNGTKAAIQQTEYPQIDPSPLSEWNWREQKTNIRETLKLSRIFDVRFDRICWFYCIVMLFSFDISRKTPVLTFCGRYDMYSVSARSSFYSILLYKHNKRQTLKRRYVYKNNGQHNKFNIVRVKLEEMTSLITSFIKRWTKTHMDWMKPYNLLTLHSKPIAYIYWR